ncbi:concanavalin A-like lectin/glucanase domain-containing protein [Zychaea mexicana]|uniref:concanavalin A-like lectin/glucanase domain-containing protein n=1 Tax=Zychaea mexicana TaxID=64656 RepID=UPI0022FF3F16|nr:concanavalin A-like lectin/glucanase domain-containing protein [Zychaea mexicana]KAI9496870.1 concanavalin A-like lectin/glucanase domain-containing protein [Zychaea mexicana]
MAYIVFHRYTNNRSNSFVEDGILYIKPTLTSDTIGEQYMRDGGRINLWSGEPSVSCTGCERVSGSASGGNYLNPVQSARLRTIDSASIKYGKVEVRARLPVGDWLWPAIWMMPKYSDYGIWPASGEIDIMESRGNPEYPYGNATNVGSTLHWGTHWSMDRYNLTHAEAILDDGTTFADDFHTYGLEWSEDGLRTYIDDETVLLVDFDKSFYERGAFPEWSMNPWASGDINAPFDQEFYLVLNVAVGGVNDYWTDGPEKPWRNDDPHAINAFWDKREEWLATWGEGNKRAMAIDWVKIWSAETEC